MGEFDKEEKKKVMTMDEIIEKKDKEEREKIKSGIIQDVGDIKKKIGQQIAPKDSKVIKDVASLYKWVKRIVIFVIINIILLNIWATVTLIKAMIGWFN